MTAAVKRRSGRADANMPAIRKEFRALGAWVYTMPPDAGFDLLVGYRGKFCPVEVKDGDKSWTYTERELITMRTLESVGVHYHCIQDAEDAKAFLEDL